MEQQNLYLKKIDGALTRTENFPMISQLIGKYISNVFYVPDEEFDRAFLETGQPRTLIPDDTKPMNRINNEVIAIWKDSKTAYAFIRPDRLKERDREDAQKLKEEKAKGILDSKIKDN